MATHFGDLLRASRLRRGITQQQLADLSTVSVRAIRDIEMGRALRPRRDTVRLMADGLGLTGQGRAAFEAAVRPAAIDATDPTDPTGPMAPPAQLNLLIGREREVALLRELLLPAGQRLVTVTGLSGAGKTRLALAAAHDLHRSGELPSLWVDRGSPGAGDQPVDRWSGLVRTLLQPGGPPREAMFGAAGRRFADRPMLLVVDGHEPGELDGDAVAWLLRECGGLRVLLVAPSSFELPGERVLALGPLAVPGYREEYSAEQLHLVPSVRLLVANIRQVWPEFTLGPATAGVVAELCRRLDGLPSALESAASWLLVYQLREVLDAVHADPFGVLVRPGQAGGRGDLLAALHRLIDSLEPAERALLAALAAVPGSWSVPDAVSVSGLPVAVCARVVRRFVLRGAVRRTGGHLDSRFRVLNLVRAAWSSRAAGPSCRPVAGRPAGGRLRPAIASDLEMAAS